MAVRKLEKDEWQRYFDAVSRHLPAAEVEIEVIGPEIGDQRAVAWVPWHGITYDGNSDVVEVVTDSLDHMIQKPQEIFVDDTDTGISSVEVIDGDGNKQIIRLRTPFQVTLELPEM